AGAWLGTPPGSRGAYRVQVRSLVDGDAVARLGPVSKCSVEPRRGPGGDPARRRFVWIPVLYPDETPTRPVVVWARRRPARHFETGPKRRPAGRAGCRAAAGRPPARPAPGAPAWWGPGRTGTACAWRTGRPRTPARPDGTRRPRVRRASRSRRR